MDSGSNPFKFRVSNSSVSYSREFKTDMTYVFKETDDEEADEKADDEPRVCLTV
jgi:hypothetical protein